MTEAPKADDAALAAFMEYFRKNYPGPDTIIVWPDWHSPKIFRAARHALFTPEALAASPEVQALIAAELAALQDPLVVHLNMVAGKIAKPLPSQLIHIYGEDVIRAACLALIREAEARGMERAAGMCGRYVTPYGRSGSTPDAVEGAVHGVGVAIRAEAAAIRETKT